MECPPWEVSKEFLDVALDVDPSQFGFHDPGAFFHLQGSCDPSQRLDPKGKIPHVKGEIMIHSWFCRMGIWDDPGFIPFLLSLGFPSPHPINPAFFISWKPGRENTEWENFLESWGTVSHFPENLSEEQRDWAGSGILGRLREQIWEFGMRIPTPC